VVSPADERVDARDEQNVSEPLNGVNRVLVIAKRPQLQLNSSTSTIDRFRTEPLPLSRPLCTFVLRVHLKEKFLRSV
jgi:hypothetical protein